jgi:hypothetical protein
VARDRTGVGLRVGLGADLENISATVFAENR